MVAYLQPSIPCRLITTIITKREKILEKSKESKKTNYAAFGLLQTHQVR